MVHLWIEPCFVHPIISPHVILSANPPNIFPLVLVGEVHTSGASTSCLEGGNPGVLENAVRTVKSRSRDLQPDGMRGEYSHQPDTAGFWLSDLAHSLPSHTCPIVRRSASSWLQRDCATSCNNSIQLKIHMRTNLCRVIM